MQDEQAGPFQDQVERCAEEIDRHLGALANRHSALVVLAALTEQVGGGLWLCQESGVCTAQRAREILRRVEELTFADERNLA
jgi:hypothetical protein